MSAGPFSSPLSEPASDSSFMTEQSSHLHLDPDYENCDAPKFVDFTSTAVHNQSPSVDTWFDSNVETPLASRMNRADPLLDPDLSGYSSLGTPTGSNFSFVEQTPPNALEGDFLDENTPTPKPKKVTDSDVNKLVGQMQNLRTRPFTPAKQSNLYKSTTWADMLDEEETLKKETPKKRIVKTPIPKKVAPVADFVPVRSTKPLTIPVEFKFSNRPGLNSKRTGSNTAASTSRTTMKMNMPAKSLAVQTQKKIAKKPPVTVPKPFKFHSLAVKKQMSADNTVKEYVPLAIQVKEFTKTPDRFKKTPAPPPLPEKKPLKLTMPKTPNFATKSRIKKEKQLSTEEIILKDAQSNPFKARPLDLRVLNSAGDYGVPRIKKASLTVAQSPPITKVVRAEPIREQAPPRIIKSNPYIPLKPFQPKIDHRIIEVPEFKLPGDEISKRKKEYLEQEIRMKEEEERRMREFHAHPVRTGFNNMTLHAEQRGLTQPMSPALVTKVRGNIHRSVLEEKVHREEQELRQKAHFTAHPIPVSHDAPFAPEIPEQHTLENRPIVLNTELRAFERQKFEEDMKQREEYMEKLKKQEEQQAKLREEQERQKLRKDAEFHARPVLKTMPFEPKKSDKPLTEPISPFIGEKRRQAMSVRK